MATGTGLVRLVTPEVNAFTSPMTWLEKPCTLVTIEAAMAEPGMLTERPPLEAGMGAADLVPALAADPKPGS